MGGWADVLPPLSTWEWLERRFEGDFNEECIRIYGLMGMYFPGHEEFWVDYDN